jgi:hypothetical protein
MHKTKSATSRANRESRMQRKFYVRGFVLNNFCIKVRVAQINNYDSVILSAGPAFGAESKDPRDVSPTTLIRGIRTRMSLFHSASKNILILC